MATTTINPSDQTITQYTVQVGGTSNLLASVGPGSSGQVLQSAGNASNPAYSTATYPSTAGTSGNILTSDGTNWTSAPNASVLLSATGTLTSAQVKALHGTPITAIAAPGAGKVIVPISVVSKLNYGGSNVFVAGASQTIGVYYTTALAIGNTFTIALNAFIVASVTTTQINTDGITAALIVQASTNIENKPILLYNPVATEVTGNAANNNTITWQIIYYIATI